jgi:hypothetical protein
MAHRRRISYRMFKIRYNDEHMNILSKKKKKNIIKPVELVVF